MKPIFKAYYTKRTDKRYYKLTHRQFIHIHNDINTKDTMSYVKLHNWQRTTKPVI